MGRMHANKQRWVLILDPCIHVSQNYTPYTTGIAQDVFVKDITGKPYLGQVRTRLNGLNLAQYWVRSVCITVKQHGPCQGYVQCRPSEPCGLSCRPLVICSLAAYRDIFARSVTLHMCPALMTAQGLHDK